MGIKPYFPSFEEYLEKNFSELAEEYAEERREFFEEWALKRWRDEKDGGGN